MDGGGLRTRIETLAVRGVTLASDRQVRVLVQGFCLGIVRCGSQYRFTAGPMREVFSLPAVSARVVVQLLSPFGVVRRTLDLAPQLSLQRVRMPEQQSPRLAFDSRGCTPVVHNAAPRLASTARPPRLLPVRTSLPSWQALLAGQRPLRLRVHTRVQAPRLHRAAFVQELHDCQRRAGDVGYDADRA